jgi:hypothetical protein
VAFFSRSVAARYGDSGASGCIFSACVDIVDLQYDVWTLHEWHKGLLLSNPSYGFDCRISPSLCELDPRPLISSAK